MYRLLAPDVHIAHTQGGIVVLDARHDRYIPLSREQSDALRHLLCGPPSHDAASVDPSRYAEFFERSGIIRAEQSRSNDPYPYPYPDPEDGYPTQAFDGWHIRPEDFDKRAPAPKVLRALHVLHHVHRKMQDARLHGLIACVEQLQDSGTTQYRHMSDYSVHVAALNRACMVHPRPTKCLAWAVALILLAARDGDRLDLVLGVTRSPFYAHAWTEARGLVVGDDPDRRKQLAVIREVGVSRSPHTTR